MEQRKKLISKILTLEKKNKQFIFIDETSFNANIVPLKGISKKNTKCLIKSSTKGPNITAIVAFSKKKFYGLQLFSGGVKAQDFSCFIINLINNNEELKSNPENFIFFMDNARIHNSKITQNFFNCLNILYNAPYSSDLNPIENLFGVVKNNFRINNSERNTNIIKSILITIFSEFFFLLFRLLESSPPLNSENNFELRSC